MNGAEGRSNANDLVMRLKEPVQCHLWKKDNIAIEDLDFETVETYEDSSHFCRALLRCKKCGQLYYHEFTEYIDWDKGNDDQYSTYIPIHMDSDMIDKLNKRTSLELLCIWPRLQWDNTKPIGWVC